MAAMLGVRQWRMTTDGRELLALALDLVWSWLRGRRADSVAGPGGHAGSSARDDVPPPPADDDPAEVEGRRR